MKANSLSLSLGDRNPVEGSPSISRCKGGKRGGLIQKAVSDLSDRTGSCPSSPSLLGKRVQFQRGVRRNSELPTISQPVPSTEDFQNRMKAKRIIKELEAGGKVCTPENWQKVKPTLERLITPQTDLEGSLSDKVRALDAIYSRRHSDVARSFSAETRSDLSLSVTIEQGRSRLGSSIGPVPAVKVASLLTQLEPFAETSSQEEGDEAVALIDEILNRPEMQQKKLLLKRAKSLRSLFQKECREETRLNQTIGIMDRSLSDEFTSRDDSDHALCNSMSSQSGEDIKACMPFSSFDEVVQLMEGAIKKELPVKTPRGFNQLLSKVETLNPAEAVLNWETLADKINRMHEAYSLFGKKRRKRAEDLYLSVWNGFIRATLEQGEISELVRPQTEEVAKRFFDQLTKEADKQFQMEPEAGSKLHAITKKWVEQLPNAVQPKKYYLEACQSPEAVRLAIEGGGEGEPEGLCDLTSAPMNPLNPNSWDPTQFCFHLLAGFRYLSPRGECLGAWKSIYDQASDVQRARLQRRYLALSVKFICAPQNHDLLGDANYRKVAKSILSDLQKAPLIFVNKGWNGLLRQLLCNWAQYSGRCLSEPSEVKLDQIMTTEKLADVLTRDFQSYYARIPVRDWAKPSSRQHRPNRFKEYAWRNEAWKNFFMTLLLQYPAEQHAERAKILNLLREVEQKLERENSLLPLQMLHSLHDCGPIGRLVKGQEELSKSWGNPSNLLNPQDNYKEYRSRLLSNPSILPLPSVVNKDYEGHSCTPWITSQGQFNWSLAESRGRDLTCLYQASQRASKDLKVPDIPDLKSFYDLSAAQKSEVMDDVFFQLSYSVAPPTAPVEPTETWEDIEACRDGFLNALPASLRYGSTSDDAEFPASSIG